MIMNDKASRSRNTASVVPLSPRYIALENCSPLSEQHTGSRYRALWRKAFLVIRAVRALAAVSEEVQLYGTSTGVRNKIHHNQLERRSTGTMYRCVLKPDSPLRLFWTGLIAVLLLYTATVTVFQIGFTLSRQYDAWWWVDLCIDFAFLCDVIVNSVTAYRRWDGTLEKSPRRILCHYMKT